MRKFIACLLLLVFMAPFAAQANEIIVGNGTTSSYNAPFNNFYKNSWNETIYPASGFMLPGTINTISYNCATASALTFPTLKIYMGVTSRSSHSSTSDWQPESELTLVYSGTDVTVGSSTGWQTFTLDTPYFYDATNNLVVVVAKTCDDWTSGLQYYYTSTSNAVLYRQGDSNLSYAEYPTGTGTRSSYAANVKFDMTFVGGAEITVNPSTMDMGYRPNGAWMRPLEVNVSNLGAPATINAIEPTNSFFSVEGIETPMVLNYGEEVGFEIATGSTTAGAVNAQLVIAYTDDRAVNMYDLTAIAYDPVCPDVWELAQVVSSFPYTTNVSGVYDNYQLPGFQQERIQK